jgi:hypothetical protein
MSCDYSLMGWTVMYWGLAFNVIKLFCLIYKIRWWLLCIYFERNFRLQKSVFCIVWNEVVTRTLVEKKFGLLRSCRIWGFHHNTNVNSFIALRTSKKTRPRAQSTAMRTNHLSSMSLYVWTLVIVMMIFCSSHNRHNDFLFRVFLS